MGLFAAQRIRKGMRIWEFTDGVDWLLTRSELDAFPEPYRTRFGHYAYLDECGAYVLCGDNAKFMNHDEAPNCSDSDPRFTIALRAIEIGEELTCDYREFDVDTRERGVSFA